MVTGSQAVLEYEALRHQVGDPNLFKVFAPAKKGRPAELVWQAQEGMQNDLFYWSNHPTTPVDEILLGGRRGPGKTAALTMWLAELVGNPRYIGLILREEGEALKEWIEKEGWPLYSKLGGKKKGRPVEFHFACPGAGEWAVHKAIIFTGHLKDLGSVEQGRGHEYHRIGIEESTQIANEELYLRLFGSNRSTVPGISPKMCNTANPDGPGNPWHQSRWIKVFGKQRMDLGDGRSEEVTVQIPPRQPFRDPITGRIRIYIPGTITENKVLLKIDPGYYQRMRGLPAHIQKAWIDGDWDCGSSRFFDEWRPKGPLPCEGEPEPEWARHVVPSAPIPFWCHRWASFDWGFSHHAAGYWGAFNVDKRTHVYRELVCRKIAGDVLGAEWAKLTAPDLEGLEDHHITVYLSHERFSQYEGENTLAQQFSFGIQRILGPGSAFVWKLTGEEKELEKRDPEAALNLMLARRSQLGNSLRVTIRPCNPDRIAGANQIRKMLRFRPLQHMVSPDMNYARELLNQGQGMQKFTAYMELFREQKAEVLPGVVIHDCCPVLIDTIPKCGPDPDRLEDVLKWHGGENSIGDDPYDAFRSLCMAAKEHENKVPKNVWLAEEVAKWVSPDDDINLKIQAGLRAERKYKATHVRAKELFLPRDSVAAGWGDEVN